MGEASEETARNVAAERFAERLYPELRAMAGQIGSRFSVSETLRRTALVSEAFLRLRRSEGVHR
jgi:hypothetical protein